MNRSLIILALLFLTNTACASAWKTGSIYHGKSLVETNLDEVMRSVSAGSVVIVSEQHGFRPHHDNQVKALEGLARVGASKISVGMEFIARKFQSSVDAFLAGLLGETDFLTAIEWGANSFDDYREQVLFPSRYGGQTVALNAARSFTSRVAKVGLSGLTPVEQAELPPGFTRGNAAYYERFREVMKSHVPESALGRYFDAQSVWDEVMAFSAVEFLRANPDQVLLIIVGDFHAAYGGGLPDRLRARGATQVTTISQVDLSGVTSTEEDDLIRPHAQYGSRGDYVWVSRK